MHICTWKNKKQVDFQEQVATLREPLSCKADSILVHNPYNHSRLLLSKRQTGKQKWTIVMPRGHYWAEQTEIKIEFLQLCNYRVITV